VTTELIYDYNVKFPIFDATGKEIGRTTKWQFKEFVQKIDAPFQRIAFCIFSYDFFGFDTRISVPGLDNVNAYNHRNNSQQQFG